MESIDWIRWGVGALLAAVLLLGIASLFITEEAQLLGACFGRNGEVEKYEEWGANKCPPIQFESESAPFAVHATSANPNPVDEPEKAIRRVIDAINEEVGFDLFKYRNEWGSAPVQVRIGVASVPSSKIGDERAGGSTHHVLTNLEDGKMLTAYVETSNSGTVDRLDHRLRHELLHAVGLPHFRTGVMTPTDDGASRIASAQRDLLRELYASD